MLLPYAKCQTVLEAMVPFSINGTDWAGAVRILIVTGLQGESKSNARWECAIRNGSHSALSPAPAGTNLV
jgi:hypothetical protein